MLDVFSMFVACVILVYEYELRVLEEVCVVDERRMERVVNHMRMLRLSLDALELARLLLHEVAVI